MVKRLGLRLLLFSSYMGALASFALAQDIQRLRYGTTNSIMNLPVWVAQDARLFSKHGLNNTEVIFIQSGTLDVGHLEPQSTLLLTAGEFFKEPFFL